MTIILRNGFTYSRSIFSVLSRRFGMTALLETKQWRVNNGLCSNKNAENILTDTPDYSYLDGRPTPLLHKQKLRMLKQREYASQIVQMSSELDFAKDRYQNIQKEKEEERQRIISNRLKPKGDAMRGKKISH